MTSPTNHQSEDLVCQVEELFKYLLEISKYANGNRVRFRSKVDLSEVSHNILNMKLIAEKLINILKQHFQLKEPKEIDDSDHSFDFLSMLEIGDVKDTNYIKTEKGLAEQTKENDLSFEMNLHNSQDSEEEFSKLDDMLEFDYIKEELNPEVDKDLEMKNDEVKEQENIVNINFVCDHCPFGTNTFVKMKRHVRDNHKLEYEAFLNLHNVLYIFKCDFCEDRFKTNVAGTKHVEHSHPNQWDDYVIKYKTHQCEHCPASFFTSARVRSHGLKVHKIVKGQMLANGKFSKARSVNMIDQLPHHAKRKCKYCPKILSNLAMYTDHLLVHERGENPFACDQCPFKSNRRKNLKAHVKEHLVSALLCKNCGVLSNSQYELKIHMKKFHKITNIINKPSKTETKKKDERVYTCEECGKGFPHRNNLNGHMLVHREEVHKPICDLCGHRSFSNHNLKNHRLLHFPPTLKCEECDELFHTTIYLNRHKKIVHIQKREYNCEQCGKGFHTKSTYEGHINMHLGIKPFNCRYCQMAYQNASNCMAHEKKSHKELYVRKCDRSYRVREKTSKFTKDIS